MAKAKKKTAKAPKKAPKKAAKPAMPKRTMTICVRRKVLGKAPEEKCFMLQDGRKLETVYHLIDELETMPEQVFQDHVNEFKNDFANWVEHVFEDKSLAEEMREAKTRMELQLALLKEIVRELKKQKQ